MEVLPGDLSDADKTFRAGVVRNSTDRGRAEYINLNRDLPIDRTGAAVYQEIISTPLSAKEIAMEVLAICDIYVFLRVDESGQVFVELNLVEEKKELAGFNGSGTGGDVCTISPRIMALHYAQEISETAIGSDADTTAHLEIAIPQGLQTIHDVSAAVQREMPAGGIESILDQISISAASEKMESSVNQTQVVVLNIEQQIPEVNVCKIDQRGKNSSKRGVNAAVAVAGSVFNRCMKPILSKKVAAQSVAMEVNVAKKKNKEKNGVKKALKGFFNQKFKSAESSVAVPDAAEQYAAKDEKTGESGCGSDSGRKLWARKVEKKVEGCFGGVWQCYKMAKVAIMKPIR